LRASLNKSLCRSLAKKQQFYVLEFGLASDSSDVQRFYLCHRITAIAMVAPGDIVKAENTPRALDEELFVISLLDDSEN
jgi:hypothetical protein